MKLIATKQVSHRADKQGERITRIDYIDAGIVIYPENDNPTINVVCHWHDANGKLVRMTDRPLLREETIPND